MKEMLSDNAYTYHATNKESCESYAFFNDTYNVNSFCMYLLMKKYSGLLWQVVREEHQHTSGPLKCALSPAAPDRM